MDIMVEQCRDEILDVIDSVILEMVDDCHMLCANIFQNICNSYIYNTESKMCTVLENHLYYFDECDKLGGSQDSVQNCLENDIKYPDMCKVRIDSFVIKNLYRI